MHLAGRATFLLSASKLVQICPLLLCSGVRPDVSLVGGVRGLRGRGPESRMGLKAVTFDLDDTLWETMPSLKRASELHMQYLREKCPTVQIDMDSLRAEMLLVRDTLDDGGADLSILRRKTLESIVRKAGYDDCENVADGAMSVFMKERNNVDLFDGVVDTLKLLRTNGHADIRQTPIKRVPCLSFITGKLRHTNVRRSKGLVLGAITNGNADVEQTPIKGMLDFSVLAGKLGALKPESASFLEAARLADAEPHEIVHVGDDLVTDIKGARQVGMRSVWFKRNGAKDPEEQEQTPDATIVCLRELPELLEKWF